MTWKEVESLFNVLDSFFYQDEILQTSETPFEELMKQMFKNSLMLLILEINLIGIILLRQFLEHFFLFDMFFSLLTLNTQNIFFCCFLFKSLYT